MTSPLLLAQGLRTQVGQRLHGQGTTVDLDSPAVTSSWGRSGLGHSFQC